METLLALIVVESLLYCMKVDNDHEFKPSTELRNRLQAGVTRMLKAGCPFTVQQVSDMAWGEDAERQALFEQFDGGQEVNEVLDLIFNE